MEQDTVGDTSWKDVIGHVNDISVAAFDSFLVAASASETRVGMQRANSVEDAQGRCACHDSFLTKSALGFVVIMTIPT